MKTVRREGMRKTEKLFNFRPVFFSSILFALGIYFYFCYHFNGVSARWLLCLVPLAAAPFCFCRSKEELLSLLWKTGILGCCFFLGFFSFAHQTANYQEAERLSGKTFVGGYVVEKSLGATTAGFVLDGVTVGENEVDYKLVAYLPIDYYEKVNVADEILFEGTVTTKRITANNFHLQTGHFGDNVRYEALAEELLVTGQSSNLFLRIRLRLEKTLESGMDETPAEVTKALLLGSTSGIDEGLYENIRRGGVAHIFAVSGLHVGSLFAFCLLLLKKTGLKKLQKPLQVFLVGTVLFLYAGICGFSASVVRASVICIIGFGSVILGIKTDGLESLGAAGLTVLLFTPSALFEIGFQLSFAACFGIAFLSRPIGQVFDECRNRLTKNREKEEDGLAGLRLRNKMYEGVKGFLAVSLGAQIFTSPFLLYHFGYVSGWGLLLNFIFVPLISGVFSALFAFVLVAALLPLAWARWILFLPNALWSAVLLLFQTTDFSSFSIAGLAIGGAAIIPYLLGCTFCSDKWNIKKSLKRSLAVACFCAFVITIVALNV